jgi:aminomethyltransferase
MARIEAALILLDVDYNSSRYALIENRKSSPFELGLDWTVKFKGNDFIGKKTLALEKTTPSSWKFRGIEIQWDPLEKHYKKIGLPPDIPKTAWRTSTPLYYRKKQVGYATSGCWSPILKRYIALAHIKEDHAEIGSLLDFEINVEHFRYFTPAVVVKTPFYNPERKRTCPK